MNSIIAATWIGKNKMARRDYEKQLEIGRNTGTMYWDDTRYNKLKVGDYFGFIDGSEEDPKLRLHKITRIIGKEGRDDSWSDNGYINGVNYDSSNRNAVQMKSKPIKVIDWKEYVNEVGYARLHLQCTQYLKDASFFEEL